MPVCRCRRLAHPVVISMNCQPVNLPRNARRCSQRRNPALSFCRSVGTNEDISFAQDIAHVMGGLPPSDSCPGSAISLAGFQLSTYGRFWVFPEDLHRFVPSGLISCSNAFMSRAPFFGVQTTKFRLDKRPPNAGVNSAGAEGSSNNFAVQT